jgi:hypothetical protein
LTEEGRDRDRDVETVLMQPRTPRGHGHGLSRHYVDVEDDLQDLIKKRRLIEQRISQRIDLLKKFQVKRTEGNEKLLKEIEEQNEQAKKRNQMLLETIRLECNRKPGMVTWNDTKRPEKKSGEQRLAEAKESFKKLLEASSSNYHNSKLVRMEEKMREMKIEEEQAIVRANQLRQQRIQEEIMVQSLEKQRHQLLQSVVVEHHERLEAEATALMQLELSKAVDEAFAEHIAKDTFQIQHTVREKLKALETNRPPLELPQIDYNLPKTTIPNFDVAIAQHQLSQAAAQQHILSTLNQQSQIQLQTNHIHQPILANQPAVLQNSVTAIQPPVQPIPQIERTDYSVLARKVQGIGLDSNTPSPIPKAPSRTILSSTSADNSKASAPAVSIIQSKSMDEFSIHSTKSNIDISVTNNIRPSNVTTNEAQSIMSLKSTSLESISKPKAELKTSSASTTESKSPTSSNHIQIPVASNVNNTTNDPHDKIARTNIESTKPADEPELTTVRSEDKPTTFISSDGEEPEDDEFDIQEEHPINSIPSIPASTSKSDHNLEIAKSSQNDQSQHLESTKPDKQIEKPLSTNSDDEFNISNSISTKNSHEEAVNTTNVSSVNKPLNVVDTPAKDLNIKSPVDTTIKKKVHEDVQINISNNSDFATISKLLNMIYPEIEKKPRKASDINTIYNIDFKQRNTVKSTLKKYIDKEIEFSDILAQDEHGVLVLISIELIGHILLPKEAFTGVVTADKLKKEHKKSSIQNIYPCWEALCGHLRNLVEEYPGVLDFLAKTFTNACIAHVPEDDRDRMHRKIFNFLQLAILPGNEVILLL